MRGNLDFATESCQKTAPAPGKYPPIALYTLRTEFKPGRVLLARGPENVYYERSVLPKQKSGGSICRSETVLPYAKYEYLAKLSDEDPETVYRLAMGVTTIEITGAADFLSTAQRELDRQEAGIRRLLGSMSRFQTPVGLHLMIRVFINDQRQNKSEPLPAIEPRVISFD